MRKCIRWPVFCTRCGSLSHFAEDCTRMPPGLGMSQHERDMLAMVRRDRNAVLLVAAAIVLALVVISYLERAQAYAADVRARRFPPVTKFTTPKD